MDEPRFLDINGTLVALNRIESIHFWKTRWRSRDRATVHMYSGHYYLCRDQEARDLWAFYHPEP